MAAANICIKGYALVHSVELTKLNPYQEMNQKPEVLYWLQSKGILSERNEIHFRLRERIAPNKRTDWGACLTAGKAEGSFGN